MSFLGYGEPIFIFTYPGRDSPEHSKFRAKQILLNKINSATSEITGYVYGLNDLDTLIALRSAKQRGVKIYLQGDKEEDYEELESFGLTIHRWRGSGIHHLKNWIFDRKEMYLGTGNFTSSGILRDNNVFWEISLNEKNYDDLIKVLEEKSTEGIVNLGKQSYFFAPEAGFLIQDSLLNAVRNAKTNIRYLIFTHYDPLLTTELIAACKRGVLVEGIYNEPLNPEGKILSDVLPYPCKIYADGNVDVLYREGSYSGGLMHHKTMIIDSKQIIVGSYNFTVSARDENREFFTILEDPYAVSEFMGEWNRIKSLAMEIEKEETIDVNDARTFNLIPSNISLQLVADKKSSKPFFNKNSSGLVKEINQSLNLIDTLNGSDLTSFTKTRGTPSDVSLPIQFDWLTKEFKQISNLSILKLWNRIQLQIDPNLEVRIITTWDGKKNPKRFFPLASNQFSMDLFEIMKQEQFLILETNNGTYYSCTKRKNDDLSRWVLYLLQKQRLKGDMFQTCQSF